MACCTGQPRIFRTTNVSIWPKVWDSAEVDCAYLSKKAIRVQKYCLDVRTYFSNVPLRETRSEYVKFTDNVVLVDGGNS